MIIASPRDLPKVDELLKHPRLDAARETYGYIPVREAVRGLLGAARECLIQNGGESHPDSAYLGFALDLAPGKELTEQTLLTAVLSKLEQETRSGIRKVINATGALLHTNLGRAPLARQALAAVKRCGEGYASLEFDLKENRRGQRTTSIEALLCRLFDVEAAAVVNNNAAAVMLALSALCRGREVVVSRGELVEIGGKFRIPEIMEQSGAILREVGTTNRTRSSDYEAAISEATAALLKVHRSNFKLVGFTEEVGEAELADLAHRYGLPLIHDLGSGCVSKELAALFPQEPTVEGAVASGADVICFSGDKLLGGPQAGLIIGRRKSVSKMSSHPLMRAFRCDKMTLAALEATLSLYLDPDRARANIPLLASALYDPDRLRERTEKAASSLAEHGIAAKAVASEMIMGGGAAPELPIPSWSLSIHPGAGSSSRLEAKLRTYEPPILCRTTHDQLLFDLRTVSEEEERLLLLALVDALSGEDQP